GAGPPPCRRRARLHSSGEVTVPALRRPGPSGLRLVQLALTKGVRVLDNCAATAELASEIQHPTRTTRTRT
ncbi:hypothetical protein ACWGDX_19055, partial [Streptomyces sp. NPDC055025]